MSVYNNIVIFVKSSKLGSGINFRTSRGGSGALYSQSAIVRVMLAFDAELDGLPFESGVEVWVLRNMSL